MGLYWWNERLLTVKLSACVRVWNVTKSLLNRCRCSPKKLQRVVGLWIWDFLLRRLLVGIPRRLRALPPPTAQFCSFDTVIRCRRDFRSAGNFERLYAEIRRTLLPPFYASDASLTGAGVVFYAPSDPRNILEVIRETQIHKIWPSRLLSPEHLSDLSSLAYYEATLHIPSSVPNRFAAFVQATDLKRLFSPPGVLDTCISTSWNSRQSSSPVVACVGLKQLGVPAFLS